MWKKVFCWGAENKRRQDKHAARERSGPDHISPTGLGNVVFVLQVSRKKPVKECKHGAGEFPIRFGLQKTSLAVG